MTIGISLHSERVGTFFWKSGHFLPRYEALSPLLVVCSVTRSQAQAFTLRRQTGFTADLDRQPCGISEHRLLQILGSGREAPRCTLHVWF